MAHQEKINSAARAVLGRVSKLLSGYLQDFWDIQERPHCLPGRSFQHHRLTRNCSERVSGVFSGASSLELTFAFPRSRWAEVLAGSGKSCTHERFPALGLEGCAPTSHHKKLCCRLAGDTDVDASPSLPPRKKKRAVDTDIDVGVQIAVGTWSPAKASAKL